MRLCRSNRLTLAAAVVVAVAIAIAADATAAPANGGAPAGNVPMIERRQLDLEVGEQATIPAPPGVQFSEGLPGIVDLKLPRKDAKNFVVLGLAPGTTTLLLLLPDGHEIHYVVTVRPHVPPDIVKAKDDVRLDLYFVELSSGGTSQLGVGWPASLEGTANLSATMDLRTGHVSEPTAVLSSAILPRLDLAQTAGWAKVMRHASVVVTSGASGTYSSGAELHVKVGSGLAVGLEKITTGTRLVATPLYDRTDGRLDLKIEAEVSTLGGPSNDGLPGRKVTRVQTSVNLQLGQAIVLAGLLGDDASEVKTGLPFLSQIPVLGYLFGSRGVDHQATENVLVIVPSVAEGVDPHSRAAIDRALRAFRTYQGRGRHPQLDLGAGGSP